MCYNSQTEPGCRTKKEKCHKPNKVVTPEIFDYGLTLTLKVNHYNFFFFFFVATIKFYVHIFYALIVFYGSIWNPNPNIANQR